METPPTRAFYRVTVQQFIDQKASQLVYFVKAFWVGKIPYTELDLYFWDTMEEWAQITDRDRQPCTQKERVFWHLLHQLHFFPEQKLQEDPLLRTDIQLCVSYLEGAGLFPMDCVGIRP